MENNFYQWIIAKSTGQVTPQARVVYIELGITYTGEYT